MMSIFIKTENGQLNTLQKMPYVNESEIQDLLVEHPELLGNLILVRREFGLNSERSDAGRGRLDHLFLDDEGVPVLVEVKRACDSRIRREVIGQILDYAAQFSKGVDAVSLRETFDNTCATGPSDSETAIADFLSGDTDPDEFWQWVDDNVQAGRLKIVFVADAIPLELQRVIEFLNEQMRPTKVLGIEIGRYKDPHNRSQILVPEVIGDTAKSQALKPHKVRPQSWDEALEWVENLDVRKFFEEEISQNKRRGYHAIRKLNYIFQRVKRWRIQANKNDANIWQEMRFEGDLHFWRSAFPRAYIRTPDNNSRLSFNLSTLEELQKFRELVEEQGEQLRFFPRGEAA